MKFLPPILPWIMLAFVAVLLAGCTTKSKARVQANEAFVAGQKQALKETQPQQPVVTILGQVRNHAVPWKEGLTLAQALDAAHYTGFTDPRLFVLRRGPEQIVIQVNDLLRGRVNPELEAGDIVEVRP